jgi:hypothetical protein
LLCRCGNPLQYTAVLATRCPWRPAAIPFLIFAKRVQPFGLSRFAMR